MKVRKGLEAVVLSSLTRIEQLREAIDCIHTAEHLYANGGRLTLNGASESVRALENNLLHHTLDLISYLQIDNHPKAKEIAKQRIAELIKKNYSLKGYADCEETLTVSEKEIKEEFLERIRDKINTEKTYTVLSDEKDDPLSELS